MPRRPQQTLSGAFSDMKAEYAGMNESRFRRLRPGVTSIGAGADYQYFNEAAFVRMREYVRSMDRDDFLIGPLTDRAIENQHQDGFVLAPNTGDEELDKDLREEWNDWCEDAQRCDVEGERDFAELERLVGRSEYIDGDAFAIPIDNGSIQLLEADRCRTPTNSKKNIVHGVEMTGARRRVAYYFTKEGLNLAPLQQLRRVSDTDRIDAYDGDGYRQVWHVLKPSRLSQTRGLTRFKAVIDLSTMVEDTNFATLVKQQMAACLAWSWEQDPQNGYGGAPVHGEQQQQTLEDFTRQVQEGVSPGQMFRPPPGMKLNVHSPTIPSAEYHAHIKMLITFVSIQLGMPLFMALLGDSDANFSSWRGAWDQVKLSFKREQRRRASQFHRPVYLWRLRRRVETEPAIRKAAALSTINLYRHSWNFPNWPYQQPLHDAQANAIRVQTGQISLQDLHAENGSDYEDFVDRSVKGNLYWIDKAIAAAEELKKKYPGEASKDVHWTQLYHRDFVKGAQLIDTIETPNDGGSTPAIKDASKAPAKK